MCGFCGLALHDPRARADAALLRSMGATLVHRGPDDGVEHVAGPAGLAFRRLAIIDPAGGRQPLFDPSGDVAVVCNGEIYNFRELRAELEAHGHRFRTNSDSETLVYLYLEHGEALVERLVGMFAFAVVDRRGGTTRLLLGRDRLGIKPLFWAETPAGIVFGSEPKALLASGLVSRDVRPESLVDYLVQGYVGGERSVWSDLRRLPPGSTLAWEPGSPARVRRYWDLPLDGPREPAEPGEVLEWLDRVVADRLVADVPLGAFLSGGVDSTAVVTSMALRSDDPVVACSVGFRERSHDELDVAKETAKRLGAEHYTEILEADPRLALDVLPWIFDEPHADPSNVPTYLVSRMAREHVTVALSGDGGDETFAGYRRYVHDVAENRVRRAVGAVGQAAFRVAGRAYPRLDWAPRVLRGRSFLSNVGRDPAAAYWASVTRVSRDEALGLLAPELRAAVAEHDPFDAFAQHYARPRFDDPLYRAQYADFHTYLTDQILAKVDRASMGVSLEVRVPLLDHRFVGRFANLPSREKVRGGRGKHALREALRARIPSSVLDADKRGFDTPLAAWIRGPLRAPVAESIESLPARWFDRETLRATLAQHDAGTRDHARLLWSLLVLEQWRRRHDARD